MPDDFDFDYDAPLQERRSYRVAERRRVSFGGVICAAGGVLALISLYLPAGTDDDVRDLVFSQRVWIWGVGALVVGGMGSWVWQTPRAGCLDFVLAALNVLAGLVFGLFLAIVVYLINDITGLRGIGVWVLLLSSVMVAGGAATRLVEQVLCWVQKPPSRRHEEDDEDERPRAKKAKPKPRGEDEEGERPRAKRPRPRGDEEDDEPRPKPKRAPKPAPKVKPKPPLEELPDE